MQSSRSDGDATPAYRGYRRQALYALYRLFSDGFSEGATLQPEGIEDLVLYDASWEPTEVVQVKSRTRQLSRSDLGKAFYERMARYCDAHPGVRITVASFGPIGPEMRQETGKEPPPDRDRSQRRRKGGRAGAEPATADFADRVLRRTTLVEVDEEELTRTVIDALRQSAAGVDPDHAFDLLMWWMMISSEAQSRISREQALAKLAGLGRFLSGRAAFYSQWNTDIVPLEGQSPPDTDAERLSDEFYRGARVEYAHILADVDIRRERFLTAIHEGLRRRQVVVVHSASGQGKTTLAYRYLREAAVDGLRLQVKRPDNAHHAREIALAIRGQTEALRVPTLVYVDAHPGDLHWVEVVRELTTVDQAGELIRVLVTVREEDWHRANVRPTDFAFEDVALDFEEDEAGAVYQALVDRGLTVGHIDFEEAWAHHGARKALFEFVYHATHDRTLAERIRAQVRDLQERPQPDEVSGQELDLLRLTAVASAYEARLELRPLAQACNVQNPMRTMRLFEEEYLIRSASAGPWVEGFHAVRSEILVACLHDEELVPWAESATRALPVMVEEDLEAFLLYAFSRHPNDTEALLEALAGLHPRTWTGVCGVMHALMWLGLREYAEENAEVIADAQEEVPGAWLLMLDWDLAGAASGDGLIDSAFLGQLNPEAGRQARDLRARQSSKQGAFRRVTRWLRRRRPPREAPGTEREWMTLAETLFWLGRLAINGPLTEVLDLAWVSRGVDELPLYQAALFARAVREAAPTLYQAWWDAHGAGVLERVRREAALVRLGVSEDGIEAGYIVDTDSAESAVAGGPTSAASTEPRLNDLSVERMRLLSHFVPGDPTISIRGYGHQQTPLPLDHDETLKQGSAGPGLLPEWLPQLNHLAIGVVSHRWRPDTWAVFFQDLSAVRESVLQCLADLRAALGKTRAGQTFAFRDAVAWDACRARLSAGLPFPKTAVDEWGFVDDASEGRSRQAPSQGGPQLSVDQEALSPENRLRQLERYASLPRLHQLRTSINDYCRHWSDFLAQVVESLHPLRLGRDDNVVRLSIFNGCDAHAAALRLHDVCRSIDLAASLGEAGLAEREAREMEETLEAWCAFVQSPRTVRRGQHETPLRDSLRRTMRRLKAELRNLARTGVDARILSEDPVIWDGKKGLWIVFDVGHPMVVLEKLPTMWDCLCRVLSKDWPEVVPTSAFDRAWDEVIVVATVQGRSLVQQAYRHFKLAQSSRDGRVTVPRWQRSEPVPPEVWQRLGLAVWPRDDRLGLLDDLDAGYFTLLNHVGHLADLDRLPDERDDLGIEILQTYIHAEVARLEPWLQATYDGVAAVVTMCREIDGWSMRQDLVEGIQLLTELWPTINLHEDDTSARLSQSEVVVWRDRLVEGAGLLAYARMHILAGLLGLPPRAPDAKSHSERI